MILVLHSYVDVSLACLLRVHQGYAVTLLDASRNVGGLSSGWRDASSNRPMEAGMKGFWYQYHNIFKLVSDLAITPNPFTD